MQTIVTCKDAIRVLLRCSDEGVQARREVFEAQFAQTPTPRMPAFLFRSGVAYVRGVCFSCGDAVPVMTFGRCWRCSLAWRLAGRLRIPADCAAVIDGARRVA